MARPSSARLLILSGVLICALLAGWLVQRGLEAYAAPATAAVSWPVITLSPVITSGVSSPVYVTNAGDGSGRLFIVERGGSIRIYKNGAVLATPFLNISDRVESASNEERGLLSVAFPPDFASKKHFYVYYTAKANGTLAKGDLVIARFQLSPNPDVAIALSETVILTISHSLNENHNGGQLQFGPDDGYLYLATGDGGSGGDPPNNAQTPSRLLGKMLRLDVESGNPTTYTVPASNPFTATVGYRPEIWALGLRNPWRFSFDRLTHDLYIGDVGQDTWEEIDHQSAGSSGGQNYGWHIMEGFCYYQTSNCHSPSITTTLPITVYDHSFGCATVGGYVYRGTRLVLPQGIYFYSDHCSGRLWGLKFNGSSWVGTQFQNTGYQVSSFGQDESGELYVTDIDSSIVYRIDSNEKFLPIVIR